MDSLSRVRLDHLVSFNCLKGADVYIITRYIIVYIITRYIIVYIITRNIIVYIITWYIIIYIIIRDSFNVFIRDIIVIVRDDVVSAEMSGAAF